MRFNAVIATHGRCDLLDRTLKSLAEARRPDGFEHVWVVENASDAGARQICQAWCDRLPVRYEHIDASGQARARQHAVDQIKTGLVLFLDDDIRVAPDIFQAYAGSADEHGPAAIFGGPLLPDLEQERAPDWLMAYLPASVKGWTPDDPDHPFADDKQRFLGANFAAMAERILAVGGFDVAFGPGSQRPGAAGNSIGHEVDLQNRLLAADCRPVYVPQATVWHFVPGERCTPKWARHRMYRTWLTVGLTRPEAHRGPQLRGVPRWMWRRAATLGGRALAANLMPDPHRRFLVQTQYDQWRGYMEGVRQRLLRMKGARNGSSNGSRMVGSAKVHLATVPIRAVTRPYRHVALKRFSRPKHHFFGYYDKSPWDATGRYMLAMQSDFMERAPTGAEPATLGLIHLCEGNRFVPFDQTLAWNWQQGAMLQWLATAPDRLVIYNQRRDDSFVAVIRDVHSGETRMLPRPIYTVSRDGRTALSLNFARLHTTRPGYGYPGVADPWGQDRHPEDDGIYRMDLSTGQDQLLITVDQMARFRPADTMKGALHWFNHLHFNTDDSRFVFLHRWRRPEDSWHFTRMCTANPDGGDIYLLYGDEMVSHFDWLSPTQIVAFARHQGIGKRYVLYTDRTDEIEFIGEQVFHTDGHCSFSPDRKWMLTDTYPDRDHMRSLMLYRLADRHCVDIGTFYAGSFLAGELRCDLHPRWSRDGRFVCFDSVHEGTRQMYVADVSTIVAS